MSARPGIRYFPLPSTRRAPEGTFTLRAAPTSVMRPSRTTTVASRRVVSPVIGMTVTSVIAKTPGASALRDGLPWSAPRGVVSAMMARAHNVECRMMGRGVRMWVVRIVAAVRGNR